MTSACLGARICSKEAGSRTSNDAEKPGIQLSSFSREIDVRKDGALASRDWTVFPGSREQQNNSFQSRQSKASFFRTLMYTDVWTEVPLHGEQSFGRLVLLEVQYLFVRLIVIGVV